MVVEYDRDERRCKISLSGYLRALGQRFQRGAIPTYTPLAPNTTLGGEGEDDMVLDGELRARYKAIVGALLYAATTARPDVSFAVTQLSKFMQNPRASYLDAAHHVLDYLVTTANMGIVYQAAAPAIDTTLHGFADATWASEHDMRAVSGFVFMLAGGPLTWATRIQRSVAASSAEAEYISLSEAVKEVKFLKNLIVEVYNSKTIPPVRIFQDNKATIDIAQRNATSKKMRHIALRYHIVRASVEEREVVLSYVPSHAMLADCLTKALSRVVFENFRNTLLG